MTTLRSSLIRLAQAQPELRPQLLPLLEKKTSATAGVIIEVILEAAMRDYRTDPEAPVQTRDTLPKNLAFVRVTLPNIGEARKWITKFTGDIKDNWDKGLGKNWQGAFKVRNPSTPYGGGATQPENITPDNFREAYLRVDQITARGDRKRLYSWNWSRGGTGWH